MHPDYPFIAIPIVLFASLAYAIAAVANARARAKVAAAVSSHELLHELLSTEAETRRMASLRWGIVLVSLAAGFMIIEVAGWRSLSAGVVAVLLGATGAGHLIFFTVAHRWQRAS